MTGRFNLSALAVRERAITLFLIIALAASGIYSFVKLGRAEDPAFTVKVLTVTAMWPGATAQEMQDLVAEPMEKRMQELRWFDKVETVTRPGTALMVVTLKDTMPPADVQSEFYQLRKKLQDQAPRLPKGVQGPFVNDEYSDVSFSLFALQAPGLPPRLLTREAEKVRSQLLQVPGVKKVNILGEQSERIFIDLDEAKLHNLATYSKGQWAFNASADQTQKTSLLIGLGLDHALNDQRRLGARVSLLRLLAAPHQDQGGGQTQDGAKRAKKSHAGLRVGK